MMFGTYQLPSMLCTTYMLEVVILGCRLRLRLPLLALLEHKDLGVHVGILPTEVSPLLYTTIACWSVERC